MKYDSLIYGRSSLERIVSVEDLDGMLHVFQELSNGEIQESFQPNKYWMLASQQLDKNFVRLKGDLYYKWGKQYSSRLGFIRDKRNFTFRDTFSIYNGKESSMINKGVTYFKGMLHNEVSILAFDIETTGLTHDHNSKVLLIANTFRKNGKISRKLFSIDDYVSDGVMLAAWSEWVREVNPSLICGHNIFSFDLPYIQFVANTYGIPLKLGRDGSELKFDKYESKFRKDATMFYHYHKAHIYGRELVDTMFLSIRHDIGRKYESYGLKAIIKAEGLEVPNRVFYDANKIRFNYTDPIEWEKIKQYAEHDGDDALSLYDLMAPPFFYLSQSVPKPYQLLLESASGSQINSVMIRAYLQEGHSLPQANESIEYEGAISLGNPGIYKNVFKVDVASLYPSIMLQYKVFNPEKDPKGYFLQLVEAYTKRRLEHKKKAKETKDKYYDDLQNAEKIFINSCYGFLGTPGLLFNYPKGAGEVTKYGREILEKSIQWATKEERFQIVNADTDSISISAQGSDLSATERSELLQELNSLYPEKIRFEDDGYYPRVLVIKAKNYVLWDGTNMKKKGSALKASTKEPALKEFIEEILNAINADQNNFQEIYNRYAKEILDVQDMKRWVTRKTITSNVLNAERTNEQKVLDAIAGSDYVEGDRCYMYFKSDSSLGLLENFDGDYNKNSLLKKLFDTAKIFETVLDSKVLFSNYSLKRNKTLLETL